MPALHLRDVTEDQMKEWKASAASQGQTLREWVILRLGETLTPPTAKPAIGKPRERPPIDASLPDVVELPPAPARIAAPSIHTGKYERPAHDAATCTAYGCGMCKVAKGK